MLDMNIKALQYAKKNIANERLNSLLFPVGGLIQFLPFKLESFDFIYMFDVLEHIFKEDRNVMFSEIKRILKSSGYLLIVCPNRNNYDDGTQHVCFYTERSLKKILLKMDFRVEYVNNYREIDLNNKKHDDLIAFCQKKSDIIEK